MRDQRLDNWADLLVNYSLAAKRGETAFLLGDPETMPLLEAAYEKFLQAGVKVECYILPKSFTEILLSKGNDDQITYTPKGRLACAQQCDLYLYIGSNSNSKMLSGIPSKKQSLAAAGYKPILDAILNRGSVKSLRWCITLFPTPSSAQDAEMGTHEFEEFVFNAGHFNDSAPVAFWKEFEKKQANLISYLETKKELKFQNHQGTNLTVNVDGMKWVNCCGRVNFPDGEVFTGPNLKAADGGVNGVVKYALPTNYRNVEVHDIELHFKNGAVVDARASKNEAFLHEMISQDPGAKFVGEIAIGTNYRIQKCIKNILYDEKIGGTFHLALGKGYPETGNTNESALHWDMIFDMRKGGSIYADGDLVTKDGKFVRPEWPQPQH